MIDRRPIEEAKREILSIAESDLRASPGLNEYAKHLRTLPEWSGVVLNIKIEVEVIEPQLGMVVMVRREEESSKWDWLKHALRRLFGWA